MFVIDLANIGRVFIIGIMSYAALIFLLRVSGKRTLSKMNAFDLIVTVALGSSFANMLLSDRSFFEGLMAFTTLIGLQFVITWLSVRSARVRSFVKAEPRLLFFKGNFIEQALMQERVTRDEVIAAIRSQGLPQLDEVEAVVLETDGSMTALPYVKGAVTALEGVLSPQTAI